MEFFDSAYLYHIRSCAAYSCAAGIQEVCKVYYVRLARSVVYNRNAVAYCRSYHQIGGCPDGHSVEEDICPADSVRSVYFNISAFVGYGSAERFKALYMLIYRTWTEIASARKSHFGI